MDTKRLNSRILYLYDTHSVGSIMTLEKLERGEISELKRISIWDIESELKNREILLSGFDIPFLFEKVKSYEATELDNHSFIDLYAVCLCLHNPGEYFRPIFEKLVSKSSGTNTIPIAVVDSSYYSSDKIVPQIMGLNKCLSTDLLDLLIQQFENR